MNAAWGPRRLRVAAISGAAFVLGLAAWTSGGFASERQDTAHRRLDRAASLSPGWTRTDLRPVSQPAAVAGRFVLFVARGRSLRLVALDARSGSTAWSVPASPADNAPGVPPGLAIAGRTVFYLTGSTAASRLVARDVATGKAIWRSAPADLASWPGVCPDNTSAICLTGLLLAQPTAGTELRFDASSGTLLPGARISGSGGRPLAPGLFDAGDRHPELLVATTGAAVAWKRPLAAIFTLPGASTDWGWNFDRVSRSGLFVGSPGWPPSRQTRTRYTVDLAREMTAGFRIEDGSVVWRSHGSYLCSYLPCPGAVQAGYSSPTTARAQGASVGVRALKRGTISGSKQDIAPPTSSPDAQVKLQGFDPHSGRTLWTFDAGHDPGLITLERPAMQLAAHTIALTDRRHRLVALNLATGSRRLLTGAVSGWCRQMTLYQVRDPYRTNSGHTFTGHIGQYALVHCDRHGHRRPTPPRAPSFLAAIGAQAGGLIAWSDTNAVIARPGSRRQ